MSASCSVIRSPVCTADERGSTRASPRPSYQVSTRGISDSSICSPTSARVFARVEPGDRDQRRHKVVVIVSADPLFPPARQTITGIRIRARASVTKTQMRSDKEENAEVAALDIFHGVAASVAASTAADTKALRAEGLSVEYFATVEDVAKQSVTFCLPCGVRVSKHLTPSRIVRLSARRCRRKIVPVPQAATTPRSLVA